MSRLLITGGAGFIGANFVRYWLREHPRDNIVVLDARTYAGHLDNLRDVLDRICFICDNICSTTYVEYILHNMDIDTIVHFAAESHVDRSIEGPDAFIETNIVGTHSLLKAARAVWIEEGKPHRFHHVSTDEVYGSLGDADLPFHEQSRYAPNSPYAASKAASDHLVRAYQKTYGLHATISHCTNNYGPYQHKEKMIPLMISKILNGEELPVYGDGLNIRDWLHVSDHCYGIDLILKKGKIGSVYNIGGGCECTNLWLIHLLRVAAREAGIAEELAPLTFVQDRPGHDRRYALDCRKITTELGYRPRIPFQDGLRATFDWYRTHGES